MNRTSVIRLLDCSKLALNQKNDNDIVIHRHVLVKFFDTIVFLFSSLDNGPSFM